MFALQNTGPSTLSPITFQRVYERSHAKIFLVILYNVETIESGPVWVELLQPPTIIPGCSTPIVRAVLFTRLLVQA